MKDNIIDLDLSNKKPHDPIAKTTLDDNVTEQSPPENEENLPTCIQLIAIDGNEERLILPTGVHDVAQIKNYPKYVIHVAGNSLDGINIVSE